MDPQKWELFEVRNQSTTVQGFVFIFFVERGGIQRRPDGSQVLHIRCWSLWQSLDKVQHSMGRKISTAIAVNSAFVFELRAVGYSWVMLR